MHGSSPGRAPAAHRTRPGIRVCGLEEVPPPRIGPLLGLPQIYNEKQRVKKSVVLMSMTTTTTDPLSGKKIDLHC